MNRTRRRRGLLAAIGAGLTVLVLVGAVLGVWARRSFLDTEVFTVRAGDLVAAPEVQAALSTFLAEQVAELVEPTALVAGVLPERLDRLAGPLGAAVERFVGEQIEAFVASDAFAAGWRNVVERAHGRAVGVLRGHTDLLHEGDDSVVVDLMPVIDEALAWIVERDPGVLDLAVDLPTLTMGTAPDEARARLEQAFGVELDADFATFTVYDEGRLSSAQKAIAVSERLVVALAVLVPLLAAAALAVSARRRRTLLQLGAAVVGAMVVVRLFVTHFQQEVVGLVPGESRGPAVEVATGAFLQPLRDGARWVAIVALVVFLAAVLTGPYPWADRLRRQARGSSPNATARS